MGEGTLPRSPLAHLIGGELEEGAIICRRPATGWLSGMGGTLYGDGLGPICRLRIFGPVQSTQPAAHSWATLDLKVRHLRQLAPNRDRLRTKATVVHRGHRLAVTRAEICQKRRPPGGSRGSLSDPPAPRPLGRLGPTHR